MKKGSVFSPDGKSFAPSQRRGAVAATTLPQRSGDTPDGI
jgi:hypothetical protein